MKVEKTGLAGVIILEPDVYYDERGFFMEIYQQERYEQLGITNTFVQDNLSFSRKGVLRGLHYQFPNGQAKLVFVVEGEIFDVAVDIRKGSPTFGRWISVILSKENKREIFIPAGFAHGFCVLSDTAIVVYKCSDFYSPENEWGVLWSDPDLAINWPVESPTVSEKDSSYPRLKNIPSCKLPRIR